jgi:RimJ/RimL family protein N-acetyltransferase
VGALDLSPLAGLRVRTARLELRLPTDGEIVALARLAEQGIHPPEEMPFLVPWTDAIGQPDFLERYVAFHEDARRTWSPDRWSLQLAVWAGGKLIGSQGLEAEQFATARTVVTGSWLGRRSQGRGLGTEMRAAVLELAFRGLGAEVARSGALEGNVASLRVSTKLGYEAVGERVAAPRGEPVRETTLELTRERWAARPPADVVLEGLGPWLPLFGAAPGG